MNSAELIKLLTADGRVLRSVKGSHHVYTHPAKPGHLSVPHPRKDLAACRTFLASAPEALYARAHGETRSGLLARAVQRVMSG